MKSGEKQHHIYVVAGPTASGKSDFAVKLAKECNGEIISADSRQIYKGLDIGTGKITKEEMEGIPHYMLDIYDIEKDFSVTEYKRLATPILLDILARGKTPIVCGGTGQYIDTLIFDTAIPEVPPHKKLREALEMKSTEELFEELNIKDSTRAQNIDKHNRVRLVRALEIIDALGFVPQQDEPGLLYETSLYLMSPSRDTLRTRITKRLEKRLTEGMVDEVKSVTQKGYTSDNMKKFGLEYVTVGKYLEGKLTEEEMKIELINKSMQYAKRQETWNKKYLPIAKIVNVE